MEFVNRLKESNPTLEIDDKNLRTKGIHMLSNPDKLRKADIKINDNTVDISMSMSFGYSLKLNLSLIKSSKEMFFQKVTQPLLKLVQDLKSSENELRRLLKKKDLEIEEYKSEGAQVARHFKTSKFDDEQHMTQFKVYEESFGVSMIPGDLLERSVDLPENKVVKVEPVSVKVEPSEQVSVKTEVTPLVNIKSEPETPPVLDSQTIQATVSVKRENVKTEPRPASDPRKRMKVGLNF